MYRVVRVIAEVHWRAKIHTECGLLVASTVLCSETVLRALLRVSQRTTTGYSLPYYAILNCLVWQLAILNCSWAILTLRDKY